MKFLKFFGVASIAGLLLTSCASVAHVEKDETAQEKSRCMQRMEGTSKSKKQ